MADTPSSDTSQRAGATPTGYTIAIQDGSVTTLTDEIVERFRSPLRTAHRDSRTPRSSGTA